MRFSVSLDDAQYEALVVRAGEEARPVASMAALLLRDALAGRVVPAWARKLESVEVERGIGAPDQADLRASVRADSATDGVSAASPVTPPRSTSSGRCPMDVPKGVMCKVCGKPH